MSDQQNNNQLETETVDVSQLSQIENHQTTGADPSTTFKPEVSEIKHENPLSGASTPDPQMQRNATSVIEQSANPLNSPPVEQNHATVSVNKQNGNATPLSSDKQKTKDMTKDTEEIVPDHIDYYYHNRLMGPDEDQVIVQHVQNSKLQYAMHEFVKTNEVGQMIQDALSQMMNKLNDRDKVIQAHKQQLRKHDTLFTKISTEMKAIQKLQKTQNEMQLNLKKIVQNADETNSTLDNAKAEMRQRFDTQGSINEKLAQKLENNRSSCDLMNLKCTEIQESIDKVEDKMRAEFLKDKKELENAIFTLTQRCGDAPEKLKSCIQGIDKMKKEIQSNFLVEIGKTFRQFQPLTNRVTELELRIKTLPLYEQHVNQVQSQMSQMMSLETNLQQTRRFLEKSLPLMIHFQVCEGLTKTVTCQQQWNAIKAFERAKLEELSPNTRDIRPPKTQQFQKQIDAYGDFLYKCDRGCLPFVMRHPKIDPNTGRIVGDWSNRMLDTELEFFLKDEEFGKREESVQKQIQAFQKQLKDQIEEMIPEAPPEQEEGLSQLDLEAMQTEERISALRKFNQSPVNRDANFSNQSNKQNKFFGKGNNQNNRQHSPLNSVLPSQPSTTKDEGGDLQVNKVATKQSVGKQKTLAKKATHKDTKNSGPQGIMIMRKPDNKVVKLLECRISQAIRAGFNELQQFSTQCNALMELQRFENNALVDRLTWQDSYVKQLKNHIMDITTQQIAKQTLRNKCDKLEQEHLLIVNKQKRAREELYSNQGYTSVKDKEAFELKVSLAEEAMTRASACKFSQKHKGHGGFEQRGHRGTTESIGSDCSPSNFNKQASMQQPAQVVEINLDPEQVQEAVRAEMTELLAKIDAAEKKLDDGHRVIQEANEKVDATVQLLQVTEEDLKKYTEERIKELFVQNDKNVWKAKESISDQGNEIQNQMRKRAGELTGLCEETQKQVELNTEIVNDLQELFKRDYQEFVRERMRWKSDFKSAQEKAVSNFSSIQEILKACLTQNEGNTLSIKRILEILMIDQLIQKQDVEDRKQIALFGHKKTKDILMNSPGNDRPKKHRRVDSQESEAINYGGEVCQSPSTIGQPRTTIHVQTSIDMEDNAHNSILESPQNKSKPHQNPYTIANNISSSFPPILTVDRSCLNCSGNGAGAIIHQFKLACLSYTQSPIQYQHNKYHISEILRVKAAALNVCQRLIHENFYLTTEHEGEELRKRNDEQGFVIQPLLNAVPLPHDPATKRLQQVQQQQQNVTSSIQNNGQYLGKGIFNIEVPEVELTTQNSQEQLMGMTRGSSLNHKDGKKGNFVGLNSPMNRARFQFFSGSCGELPLQNELPPMTNQTFKTNASLIPSFDPQRSHQKHKNAEDGIITSEVARLQKQRRRNANQMLLLRTAHQGSTSTKTSINNQLTAKNQRNSNQLLFGGQSLNDFNSKNNMFQNTFLNQGGQSTNFTASNGASNGMLHTSTVGALNDAIEKQKNNKSGRNSRTGNGSRLQNQQRNSMVVGPIVSPQNQNMNQRYSSNQQDPRPNSQSNVYNHHNNNNILHEHPISIQSVSGLALKHNAFQQQSSKKHGHNLTQKFASSGDNGISGAKFNSLQNQSTNEFQAVLLEKSGRIREYQQNQKVNDCFISNKNIGKNNVDQAGLMEIGGHQIPSTSRNEENTCISNEQTGESQLPHQLEAQQQFGSTLYEPK